MIIYYYIVRSNSIPLLSVHHEVTPWLVEPSAVQATTDLPHVRADVTLAAGGADGKPGVPNVPSTGCHLMSNGCVIWHDSWILLNIHVHLRMGLISRSRSRKWTNMITIYGPFRSLQVPSAWKSDLPSWDQHGSTAVEIPWTQLQVLQALHILRSAKSAAGKPTFTAMPWAVLPFLTNGGVHPKSNHSEYTINIDSPFAKHFLFSKAPPLLEFAASPLRWPLRSSHRKNGRYIHWPQDVASMNSMYFSVLLYWAIIIDITYIVYYRLYVYTSWLCNSSNTQIDCASWSEQLLIVFNDDPLGFLDALNFAKWSWKFSVRSPPLHVCWLKASAT